MTKIDQKFTMLVVLVNWSKLPQLVLTFAATLEKGRITVTDWKV